MKFVDFNDDLNQRKNKKKNTFISYKRTTYLNNLTKGQDKLLLDYVTLGKQNLCRITTWSEKRRKKKQKKKKKKRQK